MVVVKLQMHQHAVASVVVIPLVETVLMVWVNVPNPQCLVRVVSTDLQRVTILAITISSTSTVIIPTYGQKMYLAHHFNVTVQLADVVLTVNVAQT